jgi:hypothetical protein
MKLALNGVDARSDQTPRRMRLITGSRQASSHSSHRGASRMTASIYRSILFGGTLTILAFGAQAAPQKEGDYDVRGCYHGPAHVNTLSKEVMAGSYGVTGLVIAKEGDVWHNVSGTCNGAWQLVGGELTEMGSCDYVDPAGDHFFGVYTRKNMDGVWKVIGGTGKFAGMEQAGTWKPFGEYFQVNGEFRGCTQFSGHWKMK